MITIKKYYNFFFLHNKREKGRSFIVNHNEKYQSSEDGIIYNRIITYKQKNNFDIIFLIFIFLLLLAKFLIKNFFFKIYFRYLYFFFTRFFFQYFVWQNTPKYSKLSFLIFRPSEFLDTQNSLSYRTSVTMLFVLNMVTRLLLGSHSFDIILLQYDERRIHENNSSE